MSLSTSASGVVTSAQLYGQQQLSRRGGGDAIFQVAPAEQRRRLGRRQADEPRTTWQMSDEELGTWAGLISIPMLGELDGTGAIDDPPEGFATWGDWRRHRWPPSIS